MSSVNAVVEEISSFNMDSVMKTSENLIKSAKVAGVSFVDDEIGGKSVKRIGEKYKDLIVENIRARFSDEFQVLASFQKVLSSKEKQPDFKKLAALIKQPENEIDFEYKILSRIPEDISTRGFLLKMVTNEQKKAMFPVLSDVAMKVLLLPVGTATVERSFSAMNRILCSERARLSPEHVNALMKISIEGPKVPDVRGEEETISQNFGDFLSRAYGEWIKKPRRNV